MGVGVDTVDLSRFERSLERTPNLRDKLFTPTERNLPLQSLAARFAAKEAVAKALGAPDGLQWQDVEVVSDASGRPSLSVSGSVAAAAESAGVTAWHVSLSHDGGSAVAMVIAEGSGP